MGGWRCETVLISVGEEAGSLKLHKDGRPRTVQVKLFGKIYQVHRIIYELHHGPIQEGFCIDHLDQNPWNNSIDNLMEKTHSENNRNTKKRVDNKTGVNGVLYSKYGGGRYTASWHTLDGGRGTKSFSVKVYGDDAMKLAVDYREKMIKRLNLEGANYTEIHGV